MKIKWELNPFPHAVVDNYLDKDHFEELLKELDLLEPELKKNSQVHLKKRIFTIIYLSKQL